MYLLDTNVLSEMRLDKKADPKVIAWGNSQPLSALFLSAVTILEIETGTLRLERRDPARGAILRRWIDGQILNTFEGRIFPVDVVVARRCAQLQVSNSRPERDSMIAATALVHRLTVATRNVADFEPMGVDWINPWE